MRELCRLFVPIIQTNASSRSGDTKIVSNVENFVFNDSIFTFPRINDLNTQNNTPSVDVPKYSENGVIIDADYGLDMTIINFNKIDKGSQAFANYYQTQSY